jgi:hypothetical protein
MREGVISMPFMLKSLAPPAPKQQDFWDAIRKFALVVGLLAAIKTLSE